MAKKPLVLITHRFHPQVIQECLEPRARVLIDSTLGKIARAQGLITLLTDRVDEALLSKAPQLRVVGNFAVGVNNIDLKLCAARGIAVVNTPDVLTRATAELALALTLAAARRLPEGQALCRSGRFRGWAPDLLLGQTVQGRRATIVGAGRIGKATAELFGAVGMKVELLEREASPARIKQTLRRTQVLSLHLPLTPETHHWLDAERLSQLRADAIVINTARGPVVDEKALTRALAAGSIFAAGLDVFEKEPEISRALRLLPNVVLAPHLGSATHEARLQMARLVVSGVLSVLSGKHPRNQVSLS